MRMRNPVVVLATLPSADPQGYDSPGSDPLVPHGGAAVEFVSGPATMDRSL